MVRWEEERGGREGKGGAAEVGNNNGVDSGLTDAFGRARSREIQNNILSEGWTVFGQQAVCRQQAGRQGPRLCVNDNLTLGAYLLLPPDSYLP